MANEQTTVVIPVEESKGYRDTPDGLELLGTFGIPRVVEVPNAQVGQRGQYHEAHQAQITHATIPAPPAHITAHVDGALVNAAAAGVVVSNAHITPLVERPTKLDPQLMGIRTTIEPSVVEAAASAAASVLVGLARENADGSVDVFGIGIVGKTRQAGSPADALYGGYYKIGALENRAVIPSGTWARTADIPADLGFSWVANAASWTGTVQLFEASGLMSYAVVMGALTDTEENLAIIKSFFDEAVPSLIVLDPDGETGDQVVVKEALFIG